MAQEQKDHCIVVAEGIGMTTPGAAIDAAHMLADVVIGFEYPPERTIQILKSMELAFKASAECVARYELNEKEVE